MQSAGVKERVTALPAELIRCELKKLLGSSEFMRRPQLQRFLSFVVEEELAGRGDQLKEYVLGVGVFGRPGNFDPRLDSLVRVEALRLRNTLHRYYETEGRSDPVIIELQKGSYLPNFHYSTPATTPERPASLPVRIVKKQVTCQAFFAKKAGVRLRNSYSDRGSCHTPGLRSSQPSGADGEGFDRACRVLQFHRRPGFRRHPEAGPHHRIGAVAILKHPL